MIVVIGALGLRGSLEEPEADGLAPAIAGAAAATGARVELISKAGDDPAGTPVRTRPPEPTDPAVEEQTGPVADGDASEGPGSDSSGPGSGGDQQRDRPVFGPGRVREGTRQVRVRAVTRLDRYPGFGG